MLLKRRDLRRDPGHTAFTLAGALAAILMSFTVGACSSGSDDLDAFDRDQTADDELSTHSLPIESGSTRLLWDGDDVQIYAAKGTQPRQRCVIPVLTSTQKPHSMSCSDSWPISVQAQDTPTFWIGTAGPDKNDEGQWTQIGPEIWRESP